MQHPTCRPHVAPVAHLARPLLLLSLTLGACGSEVVRPLPEDASSDRPADASTVPVCDLATQGNCAEGAECLLDDRCTVCTCTATGEFSCDSSACTPPPAPPPSAKPDGGATGSTGTCVMPNGGLCTVGNACSSGCLTCRCDGLSEFASCSPTPFCDGGAGGG